MGVFQRGVCAELGRAGGLWGHEWEFADWLGVDVDCEDYEGGCEEDWEGFVSGGD